MVLTTLYDTAVCKPPSRPPPTPQTAGSAKPGGGGQARQAGVNGVSALTLCLTQAGLSIHIREMNEFGSEPLGKAFTMDQPEGKTHIRFPGGSEERETGREVGGGGGGPAGAASAASHPRTALLHARAHRQLAV